MKIVGIIGKLIKVDRVIIKRDLFGYVRSMIEVLIKKEFFNCI